VSGELKARPTRGVGWAFLFALRRESAPFARRLRFAERLPAPCPGAIYETKRGPAVVLETGIGGDRAATATHWLLDNFDPRLVVVCGYAGALSPNARAGDVFLASEVVEPGNDELHWRTTVPAELGDLRVGRLVTVAHLAGRPAAKRALARQTGAVAVDMESAAIAEACQERRVPCAVVRAISDTADTSLSPRLVTLLSGGRVAPWRVLTALARSPGLAVELWRLARDTRLAARRLADVLHRLVR
jgi:adenosylhomocysteine nucleosidase